MPVQLPARLSAVLEFFEIYQASSLPTALMDIFGARGFGSERGLTPNTLHPPASIPLEQVLHKRAEV